MIESKVTAHRTADLSGYHKAARIGALVNRINMTVIWSLLIGGSLLFMLPLYIMVTYSLKTPEEILTTSAWAWPQKPTLDNFKTIFTDSHLNFPRLFLNTLVLSIVPTIGVVLSSAAVAYPFSRLRFRGRDRLFVVLLSTMMLPGVVTMIPGYVMYAKLGWIDTWWPFLIPPFLGGGAFSIFLVRQFMMSIPREMDEAAKIDGASTALTFWRIILPNCGPVLATIAVFSFVGGFKDFLGPLMVLNSPEKQPLELGLRALQTGHTTETHILMAGALVVMTPIVITFVICQRFFVKGITLTGGK